jgi:hypothetical protein
VNLYTGISTVSTLINAMQYYVIKWTGTDCENTGIKTVSTEFIE